MGVMQPLKAIVRNGKLVVDETPTDLPEGTEVELVVADQGDDLDDEERARLHASIGRGLADIKAGRVTDIDDVLNELD